MKKVLFIAAVAGLSLVSCKKEYTCECQTKTTTYINGTSTPSEKTTPTTFDKMKKDDATAKCNEGDTDTMTGDTQNGIKIVQTCEIK